MLLSPIKTAKRTSFKEQNTGDILVGTWMVTIPKKLAMASRVFQII